MRYLIFSDIHANLEALGAALEKAAPEAADTILCLGDVVGYGADPNEACRWVRDHATRVVRGNHDKACVGLEDLEWFNPAAQASALWTQRVLEPENQEWLRELPQGPVLYEGCQIAHGSPVDEDAYLVQPGEVRELMGDVLQRITFIGHTHLQGGFCLRGKKTLVVPQVPESRLAVDLMLDGESHYVLNPGSIGQPRDGDPRAAFAEFFPAENRVRYHRVAYDIAKAADKIRGAGLPEILARRLSVGR